MRRSKYGYLLLALLVITGLAGTITSTSITAKERKLVAAYLKDTKTDVLKGIKGLSKSQLNFKPSKDKCSIKECIYRIAASEKNLWNLMQATLTQPANPEKRLEVKWTDEELLKGTDNCSPEELELRKNSFKTVEEALESFKNTRAEHFKYMKGTTEDLRNHVAHTAYGWLDCYQVCLLISSYSKRYLQQIEEIKADPNFPSR
ncbi:MAG TPA: DinB family protein [Chitinophagaceae bacterium]|jgi:DinB family protein|nr:DinB family protein [Chitinophagaceae bacterium]